jgi:hypothetical protein
VLHFARETGPMSKRLNWAHSAPHLLAAYDRVFAKTGR